MYHCYHQDGFKIKSRGVSISAYHAKQTPGDKKMEQDEVDKKGRHDRGERRLWNVMSVTERASSDTDESEPDNTADRADSEQRDIPHPCPYLREMFEVL